MLQQQHTHTHGVVKEKKRRIFESFLSVTHVQIGCGGSSRGRVARGSGELCRLLRDALGSSSGEGVFSRLYTSFS